MSLVYLYIFSSGVYLYSRMILMYLKRHEQFEIGCGAILNKIYYYYYYKLTSLLHFDKRKKHDAAQEILPCQEPSSFHNQKRSSRLLNNTPPTVDWTRNTYVVR